MGTRLEKEIQLPLSITYPCVTHGDVIIITSKEVKPKMIMLLYLFYGGCIVTVLLFIWSIWYFCIDEEESSDDGDELDLDRLPVDEDQEQHRQAQEQDHQQEQQQEQLQEQDQQQEPEQQQDQEQH